jgi:hypothetical protein
MVKDSIFDNKWNGPLFSCPFRLNIGVKGIGRASTSWADTGIGNLADEVEACLDIYANL